MCQAFWELPRATVQSLTARGHDGVSPSCLWVKLGYSKGKGEARTGDKVDFQCSHERLFQLNYSYLIVLPGSLPSKSP